MAAATGHATSPAASITSKMAAERPLHYDVKNQDDDCDDSKITSKTEAIVVTLYRLVRLFLPLVIPPLKATFCFRLIKDLTTNKPWSTRHTVTSQLNVASVFLATLTTFEMLLYLTPVICLAGKKITASLCTNCTNTHPAALSNTNDGAPNCAFKWSVKSICNFFDIDSKENRDTVVSFCFQYVVLALDLTFIVTNILCYYMALEDNCLEIGVKKQKSLMSECVTTLQKHLMLPLFCFLLIAAQAFGDLIGDLSNIARMCCGKSVVVEELSQKRTKRSARTVIFARLLKNIFRAFVSPAALMSSIFACFLYYEGLCVHEIHNGGVCRPARLSVEVHSRYCYALESSVVFPSPTLGTRTRQKIANVDIHSILSEPNTTNPEFEHCKLLNDSVIGKVARQVVCERNDYGLATPHSFQHNPKQQQFSDSILISWPCHVTSKRIAQRDGVYCLYRVLVQLNGDLQFVYNYDYVDAIPESVSHDTDSLSGEWHKHSQYSNFTSIINTGGDETFDVFRRMFTNVDHELSTMQLDSREMDLVTYPPQPVLINCNRSCHCYKCLASNLTSPPHCKEICPNVNIQEYRNYTIDPFCKSNKPDLCRQEWTPISLVAARFGEDKSSLLNFQSSPIVTVFLDNYKETARFDSSIVMPSPEAKVSSLQCNSTRNKLYDAFVASAVFVGLLVLLACYSCYRDVTNYLDKKNLVGADSERPSRGNQFAATKDGVQAELIAMVASPTEHHSDQSPTGGSISEDESLA